MSYSRPDWDKDRESVIALFTPYIGSPSQGVLMAQAMRTDREGYGTLNFTGRGRPIKDLNPAIFWRWLDSHAEKLDMRLRYDFIEEFDSGRGGIVINGHWKHMGQFPHDTYWAMWFAPFNQMRRLAFYKED